MNAVGPALWRSISLGCSAHLLSRTAFSNLAPLRRTLELKQHSIRSFSWIPGNTYRQLPYTRFSTSSSCRDKVPNPPATPPTSPSSKLPILSSRKLQDIFSQQIDRDEGNEILQAIQEARAQGILDQGILGIPNFTVAEGLAWLRREIPLDEDAAILARLDREDEEESKATIARAVELGIYSPQQGAELTKQAIQDPGSIPLIYIPQHNAAENARYGKSMFEELAKKRKRRRELLEKKRERAEERAISKAVALGLPATVEERRAVRQQDVRQSKAAYVEETRWVYGKGIKDGQGWPAMTPWQRLWPSTLLALGIIGLSALFATYYTPPPRSARVWPELSAAQATLAALIGFQFLVFCAWHVTLIQRFLFKHAISVPGFPRVTALLGNTFSHQTLPHLLGNMALLGIFGIQLHDEIGRGAFLAVYCTAGAVATLFSLTIHVYKAAFATGMLGASGVNSGIIGAYLTINQGQKVTILGIPEEWTKHVPTLAALVALIALDVYGLRKGTLLNPYLGTDFLSHLGGWAAGIACGIIIRMRKKPDNQKQEGKQQVKQVAKAGGMASKDSKTA